MHCQLVTRYHHAGDFNELVIICDSPLEKLISIDRSMYHTKPEI